MTCCITVIAINTDIRIIYVFTKNQKTNFVIKNSTQIKIKSGILSHAYNGNQKLYFSKRMFI